MKEDFHTELPPETSPLHRLLGNVVMMHQTRSPATRDVDEEKILGRVIVPLDQPRHGR